MEPPPSFSEALSKRGIDIAHVVLGKEPYGSPQLGRGVAELAASASRDGPLAVRSDVAQASE
ncbi:MAG: hypothetical protein QXJ71_08170 [Pyrobaculum sp.]